jgi:3-hydroxyisobutyrate dehydrogenase
MVATPAQVEAVLYGDDPAAAALPPGSVVLVMATVGPAAVHDWATRLATQGLHLVDAPVSGGVARAAAGDLLIMVGAPEATVLKVRPVLEAMPELPPWWERRPGDGQKVKLVNQLLCGGPYRGGCRGAGLRRGDGPGRRDHLGGDPARGRRLVHAQ